jgi:hypothetical protein
MKRSFIATGLVLTLVLPLAFMGTLVALAEKDLSPSDRALEEIPAELLPLYRVAASICDGLPWTVLAAIHKVETGFGRGRAVSSAGAQGPMQFMPATWRAYATDGDGDGVASINDIEDAVFGAAALLCANGAGDPARLSAAIFSYNHSDAYVAEVLRLAAAYGVFSFAGGTVSAAPGDILNNPRITLTSNARADIVAGVVDPRLLAIIQSISVRYAIGVSVIKTGHSKYVDGTSSISNHFYGRGVDIFFVAGRPVSASNGAAQQLVLDLSALQGPVRPAEVGHPFSTINFAGGFTDRDHADHIHIGYE